LENGQKVSYSQAMEQKEKEEEEVINIPTACELRIL